MKLSTLLMALTALALIAATWSPASAAVRSWNGGASTNWNADANWTGGPSPTSSDIARFNPNFGDQPSLAGNTNVGQIDIVNPNKNVVITANGADDLRLFTIGGVSISMDNANRNLNINGSGTLTVMNNTDTTPAWNLNSGGGSGDLNINIDDMILQTGVELTITVGGAREVDINADIANTNGAIVKNGNGILRFDGTNLQTGNTTVNAGTLGGTGSAFNSALIVNAGGTVTGGGLGGTSSLGFDSADIDGTYRIDINGVDIDTLNIDGLLDLASATFDFDETSAPVGTGLIFATYGSLTGQGSVTVVDLPTGYSIDYAFGGNNIALVSAAAIPTPAALPAGLTLLVVTGARRRRR